MITLSGNPITTNTLYRRHGFIMYMTREGKERKEQYQWEAKSQWQNPVIAYPIEIVIRMYFNSKRRRDWDNFHKLTMDSLNGIVWEDDSLIQKATVEKLYDAINPRIEIEIR